MTPGRALLLAGTLSAAPIVGLGLIVPIPEAVIGGLFSFLVFAVLAGMSRWMDRRSDTRCS